MKTSHLFCFRILILTALVSCLSTVNAQAFQFQKDEVKGFVDTTISSGFGMRVEERKHALIGRANGGTAYSTGGDDGNRNYSKGSLFSAATKGTSDMGLSYQNLSTFVRLSYFFDPVTRYKKEMTHYQRESAGQSFELLDAYVQGRFQPAGKALDIRLGKQVLNWGESLFIPGGLNAINAVDVAKLRLPGSEVREALLPSPMISDSFQLTDNLSLSNYYVFKYDRTKLDICGTYFSTDDVVCEGGSGDSTGGFGLLPEGTAGSITRRVKDQRPSNNGQYGAALRYLAEEFNDTEFGLYFINYHNHVPVVSAISTVPGGQPSLIVQYLENLQVYGFSASTDLPAGITLQSEYSYKPRFPLQVETNEVFAAAQYFPAAQVRAATAPGQMISGYREMPVNQVQAALTKTFGHENPIKAADVTVAAEAALIYVSHFPNKRDLRFDGPATNLPAYNGLGAPELQRSGWADQLSWGYVLYASPTYHQVVKNVDLIPRVAFSHNVEGTSPSPVSQFVAGRMSATLSATALYVDRWSLELSYTNFWGASPRNSLVDRDFVSATVKHWF